MVYLPIARQNLAEVSELDASRHSTCCAALVVVPVGDAEPNRHSVSLFPVLRMGDGMKKIYRSLDHLLGFCFRRRPWRRQRRHSWRSSRRRVERISCREIVPAKVDKAVFNAIPRSAGLNGLAAGLLYTGACTTQDRRYGQDATIGFILTRNCGRTATMQKISQARANILRLLVKAFADRGIALVILPVPDKAEQVEDQLCGIAADQSRFRSRALAADYNGIRRFTRSICGNSWPRPGYWRTDTHWDSPGAQFAAEAVARVGQC